MSVTQHTIFNCRDDTYIGWVGTDDYLLARLCHAPGAVHVAVSGHMKTWLSVPPGSQELTLSEGDLQNTHSTETSHRACSCVIIMCRIVSQI